jgi:hypothetical protein
MSFVDAGGVSDLLHLTIDVDKDWQLKGISNIKEVVLGMTKGDIVYHDGTRLVKLSPGAIGTELKTKGPGHAPVWSYPDILP